tara:strand:- start:599 stop:826 length:228 start_codon:yes stop_codon:yes gene_type:complete
MKPKMNMNVDMSLATDITCEACEGSAFMSCYLIKKLSAVISPNGQEAIIPVETFACISCGHINEKFIPTMMTKEK